MKKLRRLLLFAFPLLLLTGCLGRSKLDEGDCKGIIAFSDTTKIYSMLEQRIQDAMKIELTLENITTNKKYDIELTKDNHFAQEVSLDPGTYLVESIYCSTELETGIQVKALQESLILEPEKNGRLDVVISNEEDLTKQWIDLAPLPDIILADKYSRQIQLDRKLCSLDEIVSAINPGDIDRNVKAHDKKEFSDSEKGITVTVQNMTEQMQDISACKVLSVKFERNCVVFPGGIRLGDLVENVCHKKSGIYGEPTSFTGLALWGWKLDTAYVVYQDAATKDRITLTLDKNCNEIVSFLYEPEKYE